MQELESMMENNNQFFFVADIIQEGVHPEDARRHKRITARLFETANDRLFNQKEKYLLSTTFSLRNPPGDYSDVLMQCLLFYSEIPYKTVFQLQISTNIDWYKNIKPEGHHYEGHDFSNFRYPNDHLLLINGRSQRYI